MPFPLVLVPVALRVGAVASVGYSLKRALVGRSHAGRTDQRAEDALDNLDEGLGLHAPKDVPGQHNAALRMYRNIRFRGRTWELDAGAIVRLRLRKCL